MDRTSQIILCLMKIITNCSRLLARFFLYNFEYNLYLLFNTRLKFDLEVEMLQIHVIRFSIIKFPHIYSDWHSEEEWCE